MPSAKRYSLVAHVRLHNNPTPETSNMIAVNQSAVIARAISVGAVCNSGAWPVSLELTGIVNEIAAIFLSHAGEYSIVAEC